MKTRASAFIFLLALSTILMSFEVPEGWYIAGSKPESYEMGIAKGSGTDSSNAATIKSIEKNIKGFGTLMQDSKPGIYSGKRVRMSGFLKSENVEGMAGLWFRVDQAGSKTPLGFDNMSDRKIKGTTPWKKYEIVLDVPSNASNIAYGALLTGTGQIWFDDIRFEIVDSTVSVTGNRMTNSSSPKSDPVNLNFEK